MSKRTAPYRHSDGSNCWTKDCSRPQESRFGDDLVAQLRDGKLDVDLDTLAARPTIGLDLDGVSFEYEDGLRKVAMQQTGLPAESFPQNTTYSFTESGWPLADRAAFEKLHTDAVDEGLYEKLETIPGAAETLQRLVGEGYRVHVITSRFIRPGQHSKVVAQTAASLDKAGIPFHQISFTAEKAEVNVDVYLDDAPYNIDSLRNAGKKVIPFGQKYNEGYEGRVEGWDEAYSEIHRIAPLRRNATKSE